MRQKIQTTDIRLSLDEITKKKGGYAISNTTDTPKRIIIVQPFHTKKKPAFFSSRVETLQGESCYFKLLDRSLRTFQTLQSNYDIYLEESRHILVVGIFIPPHSKHIIKAIRLETRETHAPLLDQQLQGDILLLVPSLPASNTIERTALDEYIEALKDTKRSADLVVLESSWQNRVEINHNQAVTKAAYNDIRLLLQVKKYPTIIAHWFDEKLAQMLDGSDLFETKVFLHPRSSDVLLDQYAALHTRYFEKPSRFLSEHTMLLIEERKRVLKKYAGMQNVGWIFKSQATQHAVEKELGFPLKRSAVGDITDFLPTIQPERRKFSSHPSIAILSSFMNIRQEGTDIAIRTILDLPASESERYVTIYGQGDVHSLLTSPISSLPGIYLSNRTISWKDIRGIASSTDIILFSGRGTGDDNEYSNLLAESGAIFVGGGGIAPENNESFKELSSIITNLCSNKQRFNQAAKDAFENATQNASQRSSRMNAILSFYASGQLQAPNYAKKPRDDDPLLTITVPSYNCEKFLMNGILSLIDHPLAHRLEIIIVNDGSKDRTAEVGRRIEQLVNTGPKPIVRLIDKENGGHGSTINAGIREATGKYFRLMDGDDYFYTAEFIKLIEILEHEDSDIVLTNYIEDFAITATKNVPALYDFMEPGLQYDMEEMSYEGYGFWKWGPLLPTNTFKTKLLKDAHFMIDENSFYVDMEYNFITYVQGKTVTYYPLNIYNYYLGRPGQSMSRESLIRNYLHHEKVTLRLLHELRDRRSDISESKQNYIIHRLIIPMCKMQYMIAIEYIKKPYAFLSFDKGLKEFPEFYDNPEIAGRLVRLHRKTRGSSIATDSTLRKMKKIVKRR